MGNKKGSVLVELFDASENMGRAVGHQIGTEIKSLREGKVTPQQVLGGLAQEGGKVLKMTGGIAREVAQVVGSEMQALVEQRGDHPKMGWVIRGGGEVAKLFTGFLELIGTAAESVSAKFGIHQDKTEK